MKNILSGWMITVGILAFLALPSLARADEHGRHDGRHVHAYLHYHDHPHFGDRIHTFYPDEYYPVVVGGTRYYYDDGLYYSYTNGVYVVANPPVGAVVGAVPSDFHPVVINGTTYYSDNGQYYIQTPSGYQVVTVSR